MICRFVVIGTIHETPRILNEGSIVFRILSQVGMFEPHPIVVTVTAHDALAKQFADLKRGAQVMVDGEPKVTARGEPAIHYYTDGKPYAQYEITAKSILRIKSLV